jgi:hypothetical protein
VTAAPAHAVVGGVEHDGPLARSSVMVLSSKGGVCSAVVVAPDAVLTAAHCVTGASEHRVHFRDAASGEPVLIEPAAKAVHPGYDAKAIEGRRRSIDLALLRLPAPLPARFSAAMLSSAAAAAGAPLTLGGYGVLREGDGRSTGTFRTAALAAVEPYGPSRILVWAEGARAGACTGDSGGPITQGAGVFALASWATGPKGRGCGRYSQGVLLGPQRGWIDRTLAGWGLRARWE